MCRFVLYLGSELTVSTLITDPAHSIINQSFHSKERSEPLNGDGFGLAWYVPRMTEEPAVFKDITPAWNNTNLQNLARVTKSPCILAHVRAATGGFPVTRLNCHPFTSGPFSFVHNGSVRGFHAVRRELLGRLSEDSFRSIEGTTDSEYVFALFMDHYKKINPCEKMERSRAMALALEAAILEIEEFTSGVEGQARSFLNVAITDGSSAVASRYVSPYVSPDTRSSQDTREISPAASLYVHVGSTFACAGKGEDVTEAPETDVNGKRARAVVIASEPLNSDPDWQKVTENHMVVLGSDLTVQYTALGSPPHKTTPE